MSAARDYLRQRRAVLALYVLAATVFAVVQWVFGQPMAPVAYALLILTFLLALGLCVDFARYFARRRVLAAVLDNVSDAAHALPAPASPIEAQYQALVTALYALLDAQGEHLARLHDEQADYYTLWVHQAKTPISVMRLALREGETDLALLSDELFKLERYIDMALQFVRIESMAGDLAAHTVHIGPVVSAAVKKYAPLFIRQRLWVRIEGVDFLAETDSKWLAFILEQLLSNALKYTQTGGVTFRGDGRTLTVHDTGIGIAPEDMARIFEKGYTGLNGRMDKRASGLGLYMAQRVARQLGIRILPESVLGEGTRMTLVFPPRRDVE